MEEARWPLSLCYAWGPWARWGIWVALVTEHSQGRIWPCLRPLDLRMTLLGKFQQSWHRGVFYRL